MPTATCANCNEEGSPVWKHRRPAETMTHRREELLCASCHPRLTTARGATNG